MPAYLLQWEAMRWARSRGCTEYDLWGVPDEDEAVLEANFESRRDGLWGVYRFKRGFGGQLRRTVGAWDRVYIPALYTVYRWWAARERKFLTPPQLLTLLIEMLLMANTFLTHLTPRPPLRLRRGGSRGFFLLPRRFTERGAEDFSSSRRFTERGSGFSSSLAGLRRGGAEDFSSSLAGLRRGGARISSSLAGLRRGRRAGEVGEVGNPVGPVFASRIIHCRSERAWGGVQMVANIIGNS